MTKLTTLETISLKQNTQVNENSIQEFIFTHPETLGLGNLTSIIKEKAQPTGGRIDMVLGDDEDTRYEGRNTIREYRSKSYYQNY